jgi:peroxiredoxin
MSYLKTFQTLSGSIKAAGGTPVIITAQPEEHLSATRSTSGYTGEAIVDTQNLLAKELKSRDVLDVAISEKKGYEHGMAQPAALVLKKDGTVLQHWAIVPSAVSSFRFEIEEMTEC